MSKKKPSSFDRVVGYLSPLTHYVSQAEIAEATKLSQPTVARALSELRKQHNLLERGSKVPHKYMIRNSDVVRAIADPEIPSFSSEQFYAFLDMWSKEAWNPRVVKSLRNLPHAIAGLYGLAVEEAYGSEITKDDINKILVLLKETRQDVVKVLEVIDRITATEQALDPKDLTLFLTGNRSIETIQRLVHRTKGIN